MKRILFVLMAAISCSLIFSLIQSCDTCNSGPTNYLTRSILGNARRITGTGLSANSTDTVNLYTNLSGDIRYDSIAIEVKNILHALNINENAYSWGFQSALACEPVVNYSELSNITVTSSADYSPDLPKGTDLRNVIQIRLGTIKQGKSVNDFLLSNKMLYDSQSSYFTFITPPATDQLHDLVIKYFLKNGNQLKCTVKGVSLKK